MQYQQSISSVLYKLDLQIQDDQSQAPIHKTKFDLQIDLDLWSVWGTREWYQQTGLCSL